ncbi:amidohydrolase family protein [Acidaminobacter sp. JC074]|uniref:metal-dependent hydrolase family protein n=1 Tax=Acidaminobacter sp. JC074 TaxID=2530199 RepID=UPI001F10FFEF|nr:amidohydrolase family protein [Acidaminobacter sp. JC074]MCH4886354.1 amidohydrolase family protein [Acidaminobacter sp. JC074]
MKIIKGKWLYTGKKVIKNFEMHIEDGIITYLDECHERDIDDIYVIPGLIDGHCHLINEEVDSSKTGAKAVLHGYRNALKMLKDGFVAIRDLGSPRDYVLGIRDYIDEGYLGPKIVSAGRAICITSGHGTHIGMVCNGPEAVRHGVRKLIKENVDLIKIMASGGVGSRGKEPGPQEMSNEEILMAVETAHMHGRKVSAHAHGYETIRACIEAGVDSIEHGVFLKEDLIQSMIQKSTYVVPTFSAPYYATKEGLKDHPEDPLHKASLSVLEDHRKNIYKAYRAGVNVAFGTDVGTPYNLHGKGSYELVLMTKAGFTPEEAIKSATYEAARLLGLKLGLLERGYEASFLVLEDNPFEDIESVSREKTVYLKGIKLEEVL